MFLGIFTIYAQTKEPNIYMHAYMMTSYQSYLVFDFGEQCAGPVKEVISKSHFVVVVFIPSFAHSGVLPFLKPFIIHHGEYCHARFSCER